MIVGAELVYPLKYFFYKSVGNLLQNEPMMTTVLVRWF